MSSGSAKAQPREWFVVLFGSRCLGRQPVSVDSCTDAVKRISSEEGVLLTESPHRSLIVEDEDVDRLVARIRESIDRIQKQHKEGFHLPLVLVIDDQTLLELHEDHLAPAFANNSFLYTLKATLVKECAAMNEWKTVRADLRELKLIMDEHNPLGPLQVRAPAPRQDDEERKVDRSQSINYRNQGAPRRPDDQDEDDVRGRRELPTQPTTKINEKRQDDRSLWMNYRDREASRRPADRYEDDLRGRRELPAHPSVKSKLRLTKDVVQSALDTVDRNPAMLSRLAEDMDEHVDFADFEPPRDPIDMLNLLELFVTTTERSRPNQSESRTADAARLRKRIAQTMLRSGLLLEARNMFVSGLHERVTCGDIGEKGIRQAAAAINLLLRAFVQLTKYGIFDDDAINLWFELEKSIFSLPGGFWRVISAAEANKLCGIASEVTKTDSNVYKNRVREELQKDAGGYSGQALNASTPTEDDICFEEDGLDGQASRASTPTVDDIDEEEVEQGTERKKTGEERDGGVFQAWGRK